MFRTFYDRQAAKVREAIQLGKLLLLRRWVIHHTNRKYYPASWRFRAAFAKEDMKLALAQDGVDAKYKLDLLTKLYASWKDVQERSKIYVTIGCAVYAYMAAYIYNLQLPISVSSITLHHNTTVMAALLPISAFIGLRAALTDGHASTIKTAMKAIIDSSDPLLVQSLKSAFLYHNEAPFYQPKINPNKTVVNVFPILGVFAGIFISLALFAVLIATLYTWIQAAYMVYSTPSQIYATHMFLLGTAILLEASSICILVVFLSSPVAAYMTGTVIPVDGGLRRYQF